MRRTPLLCCLVVAALAVTAPAGAQPQVAMKAGLWETRQQPRLDPKRQAQLEQAQKQLAALPPEQRQMMQQMMAQHGVQMDLAGGTITVKACISEEQARANKPPVGAKGNCTYDSQRSGNVIRTHFTCTDPASQGDSVVTLNGSDGFTSQTHIIHGNETIDVTGEAHWLGADCGGLKPVDAH